MVCSVGLLSGSELSFDFVSWVGFAAKQIGSSASPFRLLVSANGGIVWTFRHTPFPMVLVEGITVLVRVDAIDRKLPGGRLGFMLFLPNATFRSDRELAALSFTTPADTKRFVDRLEHSGLAYVRDGRAADMVVAQQGFGFTVPCRWAAVLRIPWTARPGKEVMVAWKKGSAATSLVVPSGWTFDGSLSDQSMFIEAGRISEYLDYLRTEDGLDIYRDIQTGREMYLPHQQAS